ncbi:hypothetical protein BT96DRAFT_882123 [Gymnopus androsaceus JB14]|uniref:Uncharacterized protein n=1 Tax=Gymnopus androsaceus JB14 TaxID=1447944 RepID=A0A6A4HQ63_9AGAR|nr:hypothetical protein BT96DRAFT_882123 [Gymnopus androsaceus JB14]
MMTTRSFTYYTDAGSSYSPKSNGLSSEMTRTSLETEYATAYDEFCLMIRTAEDEVSNDAKVVAPRKLSYVHRWRQRITPLDIRPPSSPFGTSEFPTSPVAVITPDQLCVTSLPPYDHRTASLLARSPTSDSEPTSTVDEPTNFHDLYDAELEQMIDAHQMQSSSDSSSSISATVYLPQAGVHTTTPIPKVEWTWEEKPRRRTLSSAIRWLPARIKYSVLSTGSAINKVFRR